MAYDILTNVLVAGLVAVPTTAAAVGSAYAKLRRTAADLSAVEARIAVHEKEDTVHHTIIVDRLARIETKLDALLDK